jgi:4-hydroxy-4-methyl-2-oxoglutarate aldolase
MRMSSTTDNVSSSAAVMKSSDIADAAEKVTGQRCHMSQVIRSITSVNVAGRAVTLQLLKDDQVPAMALGLGVVRVIEAAPAGSVLVMAVEDGKDFAAFGATLAVLMKVRKLAGLVVDASVRDVVDLREMQFPAFAIGVVPGSAGGRYKLASVNAPVVCGGLKVAPGDLIVGDKDGVSVVPAAREAEVVALAVKSQAEEAQLLKRIEAAGSYLKLLIRE